MLKEKISNNSLLKLLYRCIKNRKNDEYFEKLLSLESDPQLLSMVHNGDSNITCCYIEPVGKNDGMFAGLRWLLDALYFCNYFSLIPHVKFTNKSMYCDITYNSKQDPFEYYFENINQYNDLEVASAKCVFVYSGRNRLLGEQLNNDIWYQSTNEYITAMGKIMRDYLIPNTNTDNYIQKALAGLRNSRKILGVHIRGTDYKVAYKNHPNYVTIEQYKKEINKALNFVDFDKIFLATDDSEILFQMKKTYGDKLIFFSDVFRTSGTLGSHISDNVRKNHKYLLGLEVLRDMYTLSYCNGLIVSLSQVGLFARITKESREEKFDYLKVIDNGISKKKENYTVQKVKNRCT